MNYNRYKDREPKDTIKIVKNILNYFCLQYEEILNFNPLKNIYSCRIEIPSLNFGTNGKGTTKEYCLASAYGELMEKLLNIYFPSNFFYISKYHTISNFYDEIDFSIKENLSSLPNDILKDLQTSYFESDNEYPTMDELIDVYQTRFGGDIIKSIPFYDVKKKGITYLPEKIISSLAHSNGLSCGNTLEEAISQAIFEIFERYAYTEIIAKELSPPEIPIEYIIKHCSKISSIIEEFICNEYDIIFYDCSLGKKFPVVALLLIDKRTNSYKINFGSHFSLQIAVERCLTEILQGYETISDISRGMCPLNSSTYSDDSLNYNMYYNRFRKNVGSLPYKFFSVNKTWEFKEWYYTCEHWDNKKIVSKLIKFCTNIAQTVYIRNNTCMGMTAVRIYIPELSYMKYIDPKGINTKYSVEQKYCLEGFDFENIKIHNNELYDYKRLLEYNLGRIDKFSGVQNYILLAGISYDLKDIKSTLYYLNKVENKPPIVKIILQFFSLVEHNISIEDINSILNKFYSYEDILFSIDLLNGNFFEKILKYKRYKFFSKEYYTSIENNILEFINNYINYMIEHPINQNNTEFIIEDFV